MMKKTLLTFAVATLLISCSAKTEKAESNNTPVVETSVQEQPEQKTGALADYLALKNILVKSDASGAAAAAKTLSTSLTSEKFDATMIAAADAIAASSDLAAQRTSFKVITDKMIETLKANGTSQTVYVQYCPMAFNNTGASWLSDSKEVYNPYFGDKMLRCGRVTEELK